MINPRRNMQTQIIPKGKIIADFISGSGWKLEFAKTQQPAQWRKKTIIASGKKTTIKTDIEWCFKKLECGYIVTLVSCNGLVGASYCSPDDALPHWNPEKSIELAYARRRIRNDVKLELARNIEDFVVLEYSVLGGSVPQEVIKEIRKTCKKVIVYL